MSLLVKRKNGFTSDDLVELTDLVVPQLTATMRSKTVVTALTRERAQKLAQETRALLQLLEHHAASVSEASLDSLVTDTMLHMLAFADHRSLLQFRLTSRCHRALVDSLPAMRTARMSKRVLLDRITKCPTLSCVLDTKTVVALHAGPVLSGAHRAALRRMPVLRTVVLDALPVTAVGADRSAPVDSSLSPVALKMSRRPTYGSEGRLNDIELALGRRVDSILFHEPVIRGLLDKPRTFRRLAISTGALGSRTLYQLRNAVTEHLVLYVQRQHADQLMKILTTGAPPPLLALPGGSDGRRRKRDGPVLVLQVPRLYGMTTEAFVRAMTRVQWDRDALVTAGQSFSHIYVSHHAVWDITTDGYQDTLTPLLEQEPEVASFVTAGMHDLAGYDETKLREQMKAFEAD